MARDELLNTLRRAMEVERDGFQFYSMAAERSEEDGAREMFERLAAEERQHHETLRRQERSLIETGGWDSKAILAAEHRLNPSGEVFDEEFCRRLVGKNHEASALSIGILLERNAIDFYAGAAKRAEDVEERAFFRELVAWEERHHEMLLRLDQALKEEYWAENRFSPLL